MTDTLKSICDQCTHLRKAELDFISLEFARHKQIILRDLEELISAASLENEKTVVVLAGSLIESVLYSLVQCQQEYISWRRGSPFQFNPDHSLANYVEVFNRYFRDVIPDVSLPDYIVSYRNLVHINHELSMAPGICANASREMLRTLEALLSGLSEFNEPPRTANPIQLVTDFLRTALKSFCADLRRLAGKSSP